MRAGGALRRALWPARWFRARARPQVWGCGIWGSQKERAVHVNVHCTVHQRCSCTDRDASSALERPRPLVRCEPSFLRMGFGFPSTLGGIFHRHARARRPLPATARAAGGGGPPRRAGAGGRGGGGGRRGGAGGGDHSPLGGIGGGGADGAVSRRARGPRGGGRAEVEHARPHSAWARSVPGASAAAQPLGRPERASPACLQVCWCAGRVACSTHRRRGMGRAKGMRYGAGACSSYRRRRAPCSGAKACGCNKQRAPRTCTDPTCALATDTAHRAT